MIKLTWNPIDSSTILNVLYHIYQSEGLLDVSFRAKMGLTKSGGEAWVILISSQHLSCVGKQTGTLTSPAETRSMEDTL